MEDNKNIEKLKQQGWEDMSTLLDTHMPQNNHRRMVWWYWMAGVAAVLLAVSIPLVILMNSGSPFESFQSKPDETFLRNESNEHNAAGNIKPDISSKETEESRGTDQENGHDYLADEADLFSSPVDHVQQQMAEQRAFVSHGNSENVAKTTQGSLGQKIDKVQGPSLSNDQGLYLLFQEFGMLKQPSYQVELPGILLRQYVLEYTSEIKVSDLSGKFSVSVFSEMMGSFSDRFGFVNIGPGIKYSLRKWAFGLSGGLSIPLPDQKAFYTNNLPFSNLYNFSSGRQESFDANSAGLTASQSVYYEKYSMRPGYVLNLSLYRHLAGRLGLGVDVGHIGFRYDFTQKAKPNPDFAASTELRGIRNSLWYGGLSVNYRLGQHWMVYGGIKAINVLNAGDVGVLPGVRVEYGF